MRCWTVFLLQLLVRIRSAQSLFQLERAEDESAGLATPSYGGSRKQAALWGPEEVMAAAVRAAQAGGGEEEVLAAAKVAFGNAFNDPHFEKGVEGCKIGNIFQSFQQKTGLASELAREAEDSADGLVAGAGEAVEQDGDFQIVRAKTNLTERKPILWVHIHKMAGTLMCKWAIKAGEKIVHPNEYCGAHEFADARVPFWKDFTYQFICPMRKVNPKLTCAQRVKGFAGATWGSIERELYGGDVCLQDFTYATILRDPIDRLESQINYEGPKEYSYILKCIEKSRNNSRATNTDCDRAGMMYKNIHTVIDNFMTRTLAGAEAWFRPPGQLSAYHFKKALNFLKQMPLVIPMPEINSALAQAKMDEVLGWHVENGQKSREAKHTTRFTENVMRRLMKINKYDIALYEYAKRQWAKDGGSSQEPMQQTLQGVGPNGTLSVDADAIATVSTRNSWPADSGAVDAAAAGDDGAAEGPFAPEA